MSVPVDPRPRRRHEWPLALVLAGVAAGLALSVVEFRLGSGVVAGSLAMAWLLRAVLPERRAGLLVVRSRPVDLLLLGVLVLGLTVLTVVVPPPTGGATAP